MDIRVSNIVIFKKIYSPVKTLSKPGIFVYIPNSSLMLINQILLEKNLFLTKLETLMATLSYNYFQDVDKEKKV